MTEARLNYLFLQYLQNTCSRQEMEEFFEYIREAKTDVELRNLFKKVYAEIKQANPSLSYVDEAGGLVLTEKEGDVYSPFIKRKRLTKKAKMLAAAAFVVTAVGIAWFNTRPVKSNEIAVARTLTKKFTGRKEEKYLLLPDSTQVWLNAASSLQSPDEFSAEKREVYLTGEAYFDVKHADKIPFLIHTGNITTTVMGTAFNIRAYEYQNEVTVAVTRGKVKVSRDDKLVAVLTPGKAVKINNVTEKIIEKDVPVENVAGWQQGRMVYDDTPLAIIIQDLENVFNTEIKLSDTASARLNVTTSFSRDMGAEKAVELLARLINKKVISQNGVLVIK